MAELYEYAMLPEHMWSPDETVGPNSITETGALCISSGSKTGRVPKQKRIVEDELTKGVSKAVNLRLYVSASLHCYVHLRNRSRRKAYPVVLLNLYTIWIGTLGSAEAGRSKAR